MTETLPFSLQQLRCLVAAAEAGSISGAAERLHASQSAVASAITALEVGLGVQLCVRRKAHGITLTPSGHDVLRRATALLKDAEDLRVTAAGDGDVLQGPLSVGCNVSLAPNLLPRVMMDFTEAHPAVALRFLDATQDVLQRQLLTGDLDLALVFDWDLDERLHRVEVAALQLHVLLAADHPLAGGEAVSLPALAHEPMVLLDSSPSSLQTRMVCEQAGVHPDVRYTARSFELCRSLVARGFGWAILIQRPRNQRTYEGLPVVARPIADLPEARVPVVAAWPRSMRLTPRGSAFVSTAQRLSSADNSPIQ